MYNTSNRLIAIGFSELIAQRQDSRTLSEKKLQFGRIKHQKAAVLQHISFGLHEGTDLNIMFSVVNSLGF